MNVYIAAECRGHATRTGAARAVRFGTRVGFRYDYEGRRVEMQVETWRAGSPDAWVVTK